jgi:hypothetical protein
MYLTSITNEPILGLIEITDITGKQIANLAMKNNSVDVKSLPPGLYFLKTTSNPALLTTAQTQSCRILLFLVCHWFW